VAQVIFGLWIQLSRAIPQIMVGIVRHRKICRVVSPACSLLGPFSHHHSFHHSPSLRPKVPGNPRPCSHALHPRAPHHSLSAWWFFGCQLAESLDSLKGVHCSRKPASEEPTPLVYLSSPNSPPLSAVSSSSLLIRIIGISFFLFHSFRSFIASFLLPPKQRTDLSRSVGPTTPTIPTPTTPILLASENGGSNPTLVTSEVP